MQTRLTQALANSPEAQEAARELRKCVHCGFCNATCPTYQMLGDELDGPRGRLYLIKEMLEGQPVTAITRTHLDRCLTCRACETTCPSGVEYGRVLETGREMIDAQSPRSALDRLKREALTSLVNSGAVFAAAVGLARLAAPLLPSRLQRNVSAETPGAASRDWPTREHARKVVLLEGCAQPALLPQLNAATARVLDAVGIQCLRAESARCCGALRLHTTSRDAALTDIRRSVDAWTPMLEQGVEAFVSNATGCAVTIKDWGRLLRHDRSYAGKAERISACARDPVELLAHSTPQLAQQLMRPLSKVLAFQSPCTLQHGQRLGGAVEGLLRSLGAEVRLPADSQLCCGSAGTYSFLQPGLSGQLRERKLAALTATGPETIVSANVGCILQLRNESIPVRHWLELIDECL